MTMRDRARILYLEDDVRDCERVQAALEAHGLGVELTQVRDRANFERELAGGAFDVILSDIALPSYDGLAALATAQERCPDTPFLFVSGSIGEERAAAAMKSGATDYVLETNLRRLGPAVDRALRETAERRARRRAERALQESEERFRQIAESIREVFWLGTADRRRALYVSPACRAIWGHPPEAFLGASSIWADAIHPDDRPRVFARLAEDPARELEEEFRIVRPDGAIRWIRDRVFPVFDERGAVVRVAGVTEDVTERRTLEAQLRQAQKLEAVGLLAGGVAHDFNNLLTIITGYSDLVLHALAGDHPARDLVDEIRRAGERSAALTRQLLAVSRRQVVVPRVLSLNAVVRDVEKMLRRVIGEDVQLVTVLSSGLMSVRADQGQLEQVLLNLAVNARDAMPEGGTLRIETTHAEVDGPAGPHIGPGAGTYVKLAVSDSGIGMPAEIRQRIFEPFFTTKEPGRGTGLGLSVVETFVRQIDGHIDVVSEPGAGTSFLIYLPGVDQPPGADAPAAAPPISDLRGSETVLLVEDEEGVRSLARRVLEAYGYTVLDAARGQRAIRIASAHPGPIHLLIADVVMPGLAGPALADRLRQARPSLRVLYVSGHTDDAVLRRGVRQAEADVHFLQKPFSRLSLLQKVRDVLASGSPV